MHRGIHVIRSWRNTWKKEGRKEGRLGRKGIFQLKRRKDKKDRRTDGNERKREGRLKWRGGNEKERRNEIETNGWIDRRRGCGKWERSLDGERLECVSLSPKLLR
jgi:hypothetical protein